MRKIVIIVLAVMMCAGGVAVAAWRMSDGGSEEPKAATEASSYKYQLEETTSTELEDASADAQGSGEASGSGISSDDQMSGEDFSYTSPDMRYVTETQRHQNFFRAVAEGKVMRLEVTSANVRPVGDPNTSYIYFTLITASGTSNGTMVMKFEGGMWRIAAINQLGGDLEGGTNYMVPASFEEDLGREIAELQPFLTKIAEGKFAYMEVYSVNHPSVNETVLTGVVVGKSGKTVPAEMRLRKDYGIWHLTYITDPP